MDLKKGDLQMSTEEKWSEKFLKTLANPLLQECLENNLEFTISKNGIKFDGFYKSNTVTLTPNEDGSFTAVARYGEKDNIRELLDLVSLNYEWWQKSKDRHDGWASPDPKWVALLIKHGLVQAKTETVTRYI